MNTYPSSTHDHRSPDSGVVASMRRFPARKRSHRQPFSSRFVARCAALALAWGTIAAAGAAAQTEVRPPVRPHATPTITVSSAFPADIPGGAPNASLTTAAQFAWQEFIALNWPAVTQDGSPGTRDTPDPAQTFGDPGFTGPLVWHTYRGKVEIFPGEGIPPGGKAITKYVHGPGNTQYVREVTVLGQQPNGAGYGYDYPPTYVYGNGQIPPASGTPSTSTPWINLDENSEIGLNTIYAGTASALTGPLGNQILFLAKANRVEFDYVGANGWWNSAGVPFNATKNYLAANRTDPPVGGSEYVSFPYGTVELKAAWRKLAPTEDATRFYSTRVRYYVMQNGAPAYVDDTLALVALHIIHKTPTAPYFVFATFEQADNITDANGNPVEDVNGNFTGNPVPATPLTPNIVSNNATPQAVQTFTPTQSNVTNPAGQLYYTNLPDQDLPTGTILVNQRQHAIPSEVIAVNTAAHASIASYVQANLPSGTKSPWSYYKLINVQSKPIAGKEPGVNYTGADAATYYQANSVVETDYNLQVFSGRFSNVGNTITDYTGTPPQTPPQGGLPFDNVITGGNSYNMGGCMGCHGNAQHGGADFSFILFGGRVTAPDTVGPNNPQAGLAKFQKLLQHP